MLSTIHAVISKACGLRTLQFMLLDTADIILQVHCNVASTMSGMPKHCAYAWPPAHLQSANECLTLRKLVSMFYSFNGLDI